MAQNRPTCSTRTLFHGFFTSLFASAAGILNKAMTLMTLFVLNSLKFHAIPSTLESCCLSDANQATSISRVWLMRLDVDRLLQSQCQSSRTHTHTHSHANQLSSSQLFMLFSTSVGDACDFVSNSGSLLSCSLSALNTCHTSHYALGFRHLFCLSTWRDGKRLLSEKIQMVQRKFKYFKENSRNFKENSNEKKILTNSSQLFTSYD